MSKVSVREQEFYVCTVNKSAHTKKVWKLIVCSWYVNITIYCFFVKPTLMPTFVNLKKILDFTMNGKKKVSFKVD